MKLEIDKNHKPCRTEFDDTKLLHTPCWAGLLRQMWHKYLRLILMLQRTPFSCSDPVAIKSDSVTCCSMLFAKRNNDTFSLFWYSVILKDLDHVCEIAEKIPQKHFEGNCFVRPSKPKLMTRMKDCHHNLPKIQDVDKNLRATPQAHTRSRVHKISSCWSGGTPFQSQMFNVILLMVSVLSTSGVMVFLYRKETTSLWLVQESAKII
jgi:hypothetical protein